MHEYVDKCIKKKTITRLLSFLHRTVMLEDRSTNSKRAKEHFRNQMNKKVT